MPVLRLLSLPALGLLLWLSWQLGLPLWSWLDEVVFWSLNASIHEAAPLWVTFLAAINNRSFDLVIIAAMLAIILWAIRREGPGGWQRWGGICVVMLLSAGLTNEILRNLIDVQRLSPTLLYPEANLVSELVTFPTKDRSGNSFPGDHGVMSMIFAAFMLRFGGRPIRIAGLLLMLVASAPRVLVGAHWLSDLLVGSLAIVLLTQPWVLCSRLGPWAADGIAKGLTRISPRWLR
ncbi:MULTISPECIES: phosphatase PAP2 family protein [Halomonadaceae]|uniref:phosphatase PAP2 family protein n=1 Tax=Halomonas TaxID=2745 RepID=UPI0018A73C70|nr:phosphatase PAP2 family protein [Halomonas sp. 328]MBF8222795.1 phosphatase PAP2 family protein [Halomonas sp. 328]